MKKPSCKPANRNDSRSPKVPTVFGGAHIHIEIDDDLSPCGGGISHRGKVPASTVSQFTEQLSAGLHEILVSISKERSS